MKTKSQAETILSMLRSKSATKYRKRQSTRMACMECGKEFRKVIGLHTFEVQCPKCHGYDTEPYC